jgi:hypothetical protein
MTLQPIANLLPPSVRDALVRASQTQIPDTDPLARIKAIQKAIERAKQTYPNLFKKD